MDYPRWEKFYKQILKDFDFSIDKDLQASVLLNDLISEKNLVSIIELEKMIKEMEVFVFGSGPSLEQTIEDKFSIFEDKLKIAADGATSALIRKKILPDIIVTDLDGMIPDQIMANMDGSIVIVHCHGDNIKNLKKYVPKFNGSVMATTQTNPWFYKYLHNFGGFTDGDRAVFLANHFGAKKINLIGFDLDGEIGKYSYADKKDKDQKIEKLKWAKNLIDFLNKDNKNIVFL